MGTNNQISPMQFCCNTSLPFLNNPKCLDLSYKTDLNFWNCFGRKITQSYDRRNMVDICWYSEQPIFCISTLCSMRVNLNFIIFTYSAIRRGFSFSRIGTNKQISPLQFCCNTSLPFLNNPKDLDPSYKMDLDFWNCFRRKITPSYDRRNMVDICWYSEQTIFCIGTFSSMRVNLNFIVRT